MPKIAAMMIQPSESSTIDEATMIWPEVASLEVHVAHHARHDLDRRNRQRDAEEERGRQSMAAAREERGRQRQAERRPAQEGNRDPRQGDAERRPAQFLQQPEVALHAGQHEQEENAELPERLERRFVGRIGREERLFEVRRDGPEERGSEQNARHQLSKHRRLAETLRRLAEEARREQNDHNRDQKAGLECHRRLRRKRLRPRRGSTRGEALGSPDRGLNRGRERDGGIQASSSLSQ
jgi:hypothetical protein